MFTNNGFKWVAQKRERRGNKQEPVRTGRLIKIYEQSTVDGFFFDFPNSVWGNNKLI